MIQQFLLPVIGTAVTTTPYVLGGAQEGGVIGVWDGIKAWGVSKMNMFKLTSFAVKGVEQVQDFLVKAGESLHSMGSLIVSGVMPKVKTLVTEIVDKKPDLQELGSLFTMVEAAANGADLNQQTFDSLVQSLYNKMGS